MEVNHNGRTHYAATSGDLESQGLPRSVIDAAIADQRWAEIRARRDGLLRTSDYAVMPDYPLTDAQLDEVKTYRQALRDIPEATDDPEAVEWPSKPEILT